jgi:hypothetical protein
VLGSQASIYDTLNMEQNSFRCFGLYIVPLLFAYRVNMDSEQECSKLHLFITGLVMVFLLVYCCYDLAFADNFLPTLMEYIFCIIIMTMGADIVGIR